MSSCATCQFYRIEQPGSGYGRCRYNPPVVIRHESDAPEFIQPRVTAADWCGRHQPAKLQPIPKRA